MSDKKPTEKSEKKGMPFLNGLIFGVVIGVALGWWFRPPSSFPIDELKEATEEKFINAKAHGKEELADFAEDLAKKLREQGK